MSEVPIVVGLLHGFDGTGHWLNHVLIDRYVLGVTKAGDAYDPSRYSMARKFTVMWAFLTFFTYALYFTLCPLSYWWNFKRKNAEGKNKAKWLGREGKDQVKKRDRALGVVHRGDDVYDCAVRADGRGGMDEVVLGRR